MLKRVMALLCLALFLWIGVAQDTCICAESSQAINHQPPSNISFLSSQADLCDDCGHDRMCCSSKDESSLPTALQDLFKQVVFVVTAFRVLDTPEIPKVRLAHPPPILRPGGEKSYIVNQAFLL